jgi:N-methylhydantoinase B
VDEKATAAQRARLGKKRGKPGLFDFGGTIAELKKRCRAETGLAPPKQPEFPRWVKANDQGAQKVRRQRPRAA